MSMDSYVVDAGSTRPDKTKHTKHHQITYRSRFIETPRRESPPRVIPVPSLRHTDGCDINASRLYGDVDLLNRNFATVSQYKSRTKNGKTINDIPALYEHIALIRETVWLKTLASESNNNFQF